MCEVICSARLPVSCLIPPVQLMEEKEKAPMEDLIKKMMGKAA